VLGIHEPRRLSEAAKQLDTSCDGYFSDILRRGDMNGKVGQSLLLVNVPKCASERVLLIGCGRERELDNRRYRQLLANAITALSSTGASEATCYLTDLAVRGRDQNWKLRNAVEAVEEFQYRFDKFKSTRDRARRPLRRIILSAPSRSDLADGEQAVREGVAIAAGVSVTRDLGNLPGNVCTPSYLAQRARVLAEESDRFHLQVLEANDMETLGMGALLAVSRGSREPPKLIVLEYRNGGAKQKPTVLVGKGVTFDTGGISLKPGAEMDEMKYDMCGAASVLGTLTACNELALRVNVVGVLPCVENMPGGNAAKPGDIVTSLSGQTVEILNTDAEGRLILCDALSYSERYEPGVVVDIATLTGACVIALGRHPHGLLSNDRALASALLSAGSRAGDRAWELPLWDDYQEQLDSNFADMANIGGREAGAITAACFLSRFVKKQRWAHLDIAGTAWKSGKSKGATGRPVALLTQFLIDQAAAVAN
jgi:leucyl aminopeptidase